MSTTQGLLPRYTSRFDVVAAYYVIASRYHSGQSSKGYRKLSQCTIVGFRPGNSDISTDPDIRSHAASLLWKRRRDIRRNW